AWSRYVRLEVDRLGDRRPAGGDVIELACRDRLDHHIAHRRRLGGPGDNRPAARVRRELAEEAVPAAAADDAHHLDPATYESFEIVERRPVSKDEALEAAADDRPDAVGRALPAPDAGGPNGGRHVGWRKEFGRIGVDDRPEGLGSLGEREQFVPVAVEP